MNSRAWTFRPECGYAVVAGSHDEVQHFLRRALAGVNYKIRTVGGNSRGLAIVTRERKKRDAKPVRESCR